MYLYRPIGLFEYRLIESTDFQAFPPRLYWQPIFYPVLNQKYAEKIALDWNTKDQASGYIGYVTRFELADEYLAQFCKFSPYFALIYFLFCTNYLQVILH